MHLIVNFLSSVAIAEVFHSKLNITPRDAGTLLIRHQAVVSIS
jgi:hypothetical protein